MCRAGAEGQIAHCGAVSFVCKPYMCAVDMSFSFTLECNDKTSSHSTRALLFSVQGIRSTRALVPKLVAKKPSAGTDQLTYHLRPSRNLLRLAPIDAPTIAP